jgi:polyisoprenoid-binding protein YceI
MPYGHYQDTNPGVAQGSAKGAVMQTMTIDKAHSEVTFQVRHLITKVRGRFTEFAGSIQVDEAQPDRSSANLTIQTVSVDTNAPDRDQHLRSEDFFFVEKFPTITFTSTRVAKVSADEYSVTGVLTIRGVSHEVTFPVTSLGTAKDPWGNLKAGFEMEMTINRRDYGLVWNAALETGGFLVGEEVKTSLSIQAVVTQL